MLFGRVDERAMVDGSVEGAWGGRSGALVVLGEPGIGKSALLEYAACRAAEAVGPGGVGVRVLRGGGVESEAELPFAGVHLLLGPVLDRLPALPGPQRDALGAALGLRRGKVGDRFLVGAAVLSLLAEVTEDGPVVCLVDDAHWLDRASAEALVFAARRLGAEGVVMMFAARDGEGGFAAPGLGVLRLSGLDAESAAAVLGERGKAGLPLGVRERILAQAQGNPLALMELPAAYRAVGGGGGRPGDAAGPADEGVALSDRLREAFAWQVRRLPADTQTVLLVAAAEGTGDAETVLAAAEALGVAAEATGPAERAGLVGVAGGVVGFRHPLVRAAVYQGATLSRRLAVHGALAGVLRGSRDVDRRAWHRATAAAGPDEGVAADLERTAVQAKARGGYGAAAAAFERAVQLGTDVAARPGRLAAAAEAAAEGGDFGRARELAARGAAVSGDPVAVARLACVRARAEVAEGRLLAAHRLLAEGAAGIGGADPLRAARMLTYAVHVAWLYGDRALVTHTADLLTAGGSAASPLAPLVRLMACSAWQTAEKPAAPGDDGPGLANLVAQARQARAGHPYDLTMIALAALVTGQTSEACNLLGALACDARAQGRIGWLPTMGACLAQALVFEGRHCDALAIAAEALAIARDTGQPQWASELHGIMAYLAAVQGDQDRCRQLADTALSGPATASKPWVHWALGLLNLGAGHPAMALAQLETVSQGPARYHASALRSIPDLVEAAVRVGQPHRATEPLVRFTAWAQRARTPDTDALAERCHALLETGDQAEQHYLNALKPHYQPFDRARTQLLYGVWLRRARRKTDARTHLRAATDTLDHLGATPWARQARAELAAAGATTTTQPPSSGPPCLTPQELQVARLAAKGFSNRDIAAHLFLSPRTVAYHLYKTFPKLGITSRSQLNSCALKRETT